MQGALPQSELQQIRQDTVHLGDDTLLKRHKLRRGWVFWKGGHLRAESGPKELELTRDELRDTGDVLAAENAQRARWLKLTGGKPPVRHDGGADRPADRDAAGSVG